MIITLKADTVDYVVLNDGVTELQSAIKDIVSDDKLTVGIITAVGDTKYQPIGDYVANSELDSKGYLTTIPEEYITDSELEAKGYLTSIPEEYITETELNSKGYLTTIPGEYITESELEAKGYISTLKTVNGESLIGEGDIVIQGGNDGYTKEEADAKFQPIGDYYTKAESDAKYQPKGEYLTAIPDNYVTEDELNSKGYITTIPDEYVTDSELEAKGYITEHQSLKTINGESLVGSGDITISGGGDMTNYYTKTEIDNLIGNINNELESI